MQYTGINKLPLIEPAGGEYMQSVFYEHRSENLFAGYICDHPFPPHVHDVVEIVCLTQGRMMMTIGGEQAELEPGDIAMAFPSVPHSYDEVSEDAQGLTLIFLPETIQEFTRAFRTMQPACPLLKRNAQTPELGPVIEGFIGIAAQGKENLWQGYLHLLLSYLFLCLPLCAASRSGQSGLTGQVLQYVSEHYTEQLSLETTARALGISRIHLSHIFSQQLNINFRQYINSLRIDRACTLLQDPALSISQIAYQCGYENLRTFHRAFQARVGASPNQYRVRLGERMGKALAPDSQME